MKRKDTLAVLIAAGCELVCLVLCGMQAVGLMGIRQRLDQPGLSPEAVYIAVAMVGLLVLFLTAAFLTMRGMDLAGKRWMLFLLHGVLLAIALMVLRLAWSQGYPFGLLADAGLYDDSGKLWMVILLQIPAIFAILTSAVCVPVLACFGKEKAAVGG